MARYLRKVTDGTITIVPDDDDQTWDTLLAQRTVGDDDNSPKPLYEQTSEAAAVAAGASPSSRGSDAGTVRLAGTDFVLPTGVTQYDPDQPVGYRVTTTTVRFFGDVRVANGTDLNAAPIIPLAADALSPLNADGYGAQGIVYAGVLGINATVAMGAYVYSDATPGSRGLWLEAQLAQLNDAADGSVAVPAHDLLVVLSAFSYDLYTP